MLKKWLIVVAVPIVLQLIFLGFLLKSQIDYEKTQGWVIHTKDVIAETEALNRRLVAVRSNMLGLAMSGDQKSNPFVPIRAEVPERLASLKMMVRDNPPQKARLATIEGLSGTYLDWIGQTHEMLLKGDRDGALARIAAQQGKHLLDGAQERIAEFQGKEIELDQERVAELTATTRRTTQLIIAGSIVSVLAAIGLVFAFSRGFSRRLNALADNARKLAEGKALADTKPSRDEIGTLDNVFRAMAQTLKEREQENELFIYSVSHDLRSPLVNLQGFSRELTYTSDDLKKAIAPLEKPEAVAQRLGVLLDRDMPDSIHFIQNAVSRLSAIIDSLLRLSRAGRVEYRIQDVDMNEVADRVVEALRDSTSEKGAEIAVGDLPPAQGDPTIIEQVFANLASNAVKYLDPSRPGRIEFGAEPDGDDTPGSRTYYVRDNGLGIPDGHQAKLFHAFQRLHPGVAQGEGIGLALVKRMVERHGGRIWAESTAGAGSTFFVTLPAGDGPTPRPGRARPVASATGALS